MGQTSNKKFHYAFLVVLVYAIALPAVFLFSNAFGLYMVPITEELGISRGAYSLTQSFNEIVSAVLYFLYARIEKSLKFDISSPRARCPGRSRRSCTRSPATCR